MFKFKPNNHSLAFTLAEVLITLGIIGVVASMTIPTLMVNINTKQWNTAKNVFVKKINVALKAMNTQQVIAGHTSTLSFVQELAKHFKTNKICASNELQGCFSETVWWGGGDATPEEVDMTGINHSSHLGLDWGTELVGVQFANGVTGLVAYNPACWGDPYSNQFEGTSCVSILYDVSGSKNPNTIGKDLGTFGVITKLGTSNCAFEIAGTCYGAPSPGVPHVWNACDENGNSSDPEDLAIMSQYGINNCLRRPFHIGVEDYWAGAVIACGGVDKLPSRAQLAELANWLYDTDSIGVDTDSGDVLQINQTKAAIFGLDFSREYESLALWSGEEDTDNGESAYGRWYSDVGTYWTGDPRNGPFSPIPQVLCLQ